MKWLEVLGVALVHQETKMSRPSGALKTLSWLPFLFAVLLRAVRPKEVTQVDGNPVQKDYV